MAFSVECSRPIDTGKHFGCINERDLKQEPIILLFDVHFVLSLSEVAAAAVLASHERKGRIFVRFQMCHSCDERKAAIIHPIRTFKLFFLKNLPALVDIPPVFFFVLRRSPCRTASGTEAITALVFERLEENLARQRTLC